MDRRDLKPCPLCGGKEFSFGHPFIKISDDSMYIIQCKTCGTQFIPKALNWNEAIEKMNRRTGDA